jgi:hypothetical protein
LRLAANTASVLSGRGPCAAEKLDPDFDPVLEEFAFWRGLRERLSETAA